MGELLIIFGTIFAIVIGSQLISLAKKWIDRNNSTYDEQKFERLAKAFIAYKKDSERRFQNLEAIVTDDEPAVPHKNDPLKQTSKTIEIESNPDKNKKENSDGNLRNMLKE